MLVGVTGNFVSGKSTFQSMMHSFGFETYDADKIVKCLYTNKEVIEKIGKEFGSTVTLGENVDRELLKIIVFNDKKKREKLNSIMHPLVLEKIKQIDHEGKIVFVEITLLFEAGMEKHFDKIILVKSSYEIAKERSKRRGFTEIEFDQVRENQEPHHKKEKKADWVIDTEGDISELRKKAKEILNELEELN
ncbi:MAG: dephospho-CoA kinase [archaeon]|nr:dephospho-CoA kinase [archaeon]